MLCPMVRCVEEPFDHMHSWDPLLLLLLLFKSCHSQYQKPFYANFLW